MSERTSLGSIALEERGFASYLPVVVACCCLGAFPGAMLVSCAGIFYPVVSAELGVQTAQISAWMSMALLASAIAGPFFGRLLTEHSVRWAATVATAALAAVFVAFSLATKPWMFWVAGSFAGVALCVCYNVGPALIVNRWFAMRTGLVLGICMASMGVGGMAFAIVGQAIVDAAGWRVAYRTFAVATACVVPVVALCLRDYPADRGLLPYGQAASIEKARFEGAVRGASVDLARGMRSSVFWLIALFGFLVHAACQIMAYLPTYLEWYTAQPAMVAGTVALPVLTGAALVSVVQAGNATGKVILGAFTDFSVGKAVCALVGCGAVGILIIWQLPSTAMLPAGGALYGFFMAGVMVLTPMLARACLGSGPNYPVFYGRISSAVTLGGVLGNMLWPLLADNGGGFDAVFSLALVIMAAVLAIGLFAWSRRNALPRTLGDAMGDAGRG